LQALKAPPLSLYLSTFPLSADDMAAASAPLPVAGAPAEAPAPFVDCSDPRNAVNEHRRVTVKRNTGRIIRHE